MASRAIGKSRKYLLGHPISSFARGIFVQGKGQASHNSEFQSVLILKEQFYMSSKGFLNCPTSILGSRYGRSEIPLPLVVRWYSQSIRTASTATAGQSQVGHQDEDKAALGPNQTKESSPEECDQAVEGLSSAESKAKAKQLQESQKASRSIVRNARIEHAQFSNLEKQEQLYCARARAVLYSTSGFPNSHDDESLAGPHSDFLGDFYGRYYQDVPLPESIDWAEKGAIGRVHNQGNIGCFACSVAGALEALNFIRTGTFVPLSAVHLHNIYAEHVEGKGDIFTGGGDHIEVFQCIIKFGGLLSENFYASMVEEIYFTDKTTMVQLSKYGGGWSDTTDLMRMVSHQPVVVPVYAGQGDGGLIEYKTGICRGIVGEHIKEGKLILRNHSMLLVGYGFFEGERCWKLLNSWGKEWGMEGFVWIPMDAKSRFTDLSAFYPIILDDDGKHRMDSLPDVL